MTIPDRPLYDPNVPEDPSNDLAATQPELLDNFKSLFTQFLANHVGLDETTPGNHTYVQMLPYSGDAQTGATELSIYPKEVEGQTTQLFLREAGNGDPIQLTAYQIYGVPETDSQISYFTFLPGNIIVYFGSFGTLPDYKLILTPPVCKKVITVSFCQKTSSTIVPKPFVEIIQPTSGFIDSLLVKRSLVGTPEQIAAPPSFYIVVGNF